MINSRIVKFRRASGTDWFNALSYNGKTYDGTDDGTGWKGIPYLLPDDDQDNKGTDSGNSSGIWGSIFSNAGGWISSISEGIASIVQAKTGNYPTYQQDNTPKVLAIAGIGAVVLIIILVIIFKK